jgi:hypothetical protein
MVTGPRPGPARRAAAARRPAARGLAGPSEALRLPVNSEPASELAAPRPGHGHGTVHGFGPGGSESESRTTAEPALSPTTASLWLVGPVTRPGSRGYHRTVTVLGPAGPVPRQPGPGGRGQPGPARAPGQDDGHRVAGPYSRVRPGPGKR